LVLCCPNAPYPRISEAALADSKSTDEAVGLEPSLEHLRRLRAPRTAWVVHIAGDFLRTFGSQFIEPIDQLCTAATLVDETAKPITAVAPAFLASHAQHIELADEITEYDCAVARHNDNHRTASERTGGP